MDFDELKHTIESRHGGTATRLESVPLKEQTLDGGTIWEGVVHVFALAGNPKASRAYAWSTSIEGTSRRLYHAVLHAGGIHSAQDAVRSAIINQHRPAE